MSHGRNFRRTCSLCAWVLMVGGYAKAAWPQKAFADGVGDLATQISSSVAQANKRKVAILPFRELDGRATVLGTFVSEELSTGLFKLGGLEIIERTMLDKVISELKLGQSELVDPSTAKRFGDLVGVDAIVTGTITDLQSFVAVNCRLIDVQTGRVFAAAGTRIVKDDDVRKIIGAETGPTATAMPSRESLGLPSSAPPEWASAELRVRVLGARRSASVIRLTLLMENLSGESGNVRFLLGDPRTCNWCPYLVDDLGMRYASVGGSMFARRGDNDANVTLLPGVPLRFTLDFETPASDASSVRVIIPPYYNSSLHRTRSATIGPVRIEIPK